VETSAGETAIVNSNGVQAHHRSTVAQVSILVSGADSTGYAEDAGGALSRLDPDALADRAVLKVELGRSPRDLAPGTYPVVLEPAATATLMWWLGWLAFGAKTVREGRSPLSGKFGQQVCHPAVTIVDDALSPLLPGVSFDAEGVPKRRVELIRDGVAAGVVHDLASARAERTESTGHALAAPNPDGPIPQHLIMQPGTAPSADLIAGCERGLLVTRFHYTNVVHPMESTITGMTRDGTFLIEDGGIAGGVHNLRFTQSILAALSSVGEVGAQTEISSELFFGASVAPAVRLGAFTFSSATTF
jgi:predicted Zn-dependent protease